MQRSYFCSRWSEVAEECGLASEFLSSGELWSSLLGSAGRGSAGQGSAELAFATCHPRVLIFLPPSTHFFLSVEIFISHIALTFHCVVERKGMRWTNHGYFSLLSVGFHWCAREG